MGCWKSHCFACISCCLQFATKSFRYLAVSRMTTPNSNLKNSIHCHLLKNLSKKKNRFHSNLKPWIVCDHSDPQWSATVTRALIFGFVYVLLIPILLTISILKFYNNDVSKLSNYLLSQFSSNYVPSKYWFEVPVTLQRIAIAATIAFIPNHYQASPFPLFLLILLLVMFCGNFFWRPFVGGWENNFATLCDIINLIIFALKFGWFQAAPIFTLFLMIQMILLGCFSFFFAKKIDQKFKIKWNWCAHSCSIYFFLVI